MMDNLIKKPTLNHKHKIGIKLTLKLSPLLITTLQLAFLLTLMAISFSNFAQENDSTTVIKSYSRGQVENLTSSPLSTTRDEVISKKNKPKITARSIANNEASSSSFNNTARSFSESSFVIYDSYSQLIEDLDADGYYQTFSVTFDADLITAYAHEEAVVYAELYLSENGGPWMHYYSTDSFVIHGESSDDEFEVYSTLEQGFNANQYDVLIDLYQEGYPDIVASYSSDDTNSLYALPLESSDFDVEYVEYYDEGYYTEEYYSVEHVHGGSYSLLGLLAMILLLVLRQLKLTLRPKSD